MNGYGVDGGEGRGGWVSEEAVVRKIIPLDPHESECGTRSDGDLVVWTGDRVGIVTTKPKPDQWDDAVKEVPGEGDEAGEHARIMRRALGRQADEVTWIRMFGLR